MRRRGHRGPVWPDDLVSFDEGRWRVPADRFVSDAVSRWVEARRAFAEAAGAEFVVTVIGGRRYRRLAILDPIVSDARELQHVWDQPA